MADTSIIREFLVALGFSVDEGKLKRFQGGIDQATKFVGKLAFSVEAMATAVDIAVVKVSAKFEDLYYASQRMNDTVGNIRATTFAFGQMGGTAQGAMQALENLGEFFRSNPGAERFMIGLGVQTRTATGDLRGMTEVMSDLGAQLRAMPYYRAKVVAGVLGIDPRTLQALLRDTGEAQAKFRALADRMGVDQDKAAKASHDFMNDLRELQAVITLTFDKIILKIQPFVRSFVQGLEDLDVATDGWSTKLIVLAGILTPLLAILDPIAVAIFAIGIGLTQVDWSQWSDQLGEIKDALKDLSGALGDLGKALAPIEEAFNEAFGPKVKGLVGDFLSGAAVAIHQLADGIRLVSDLLTGQWKKAWADAGKIAYGDVVDAARKRAGGAKPASPVAATAPANDNGAAGAAVGIAQGVAARVQAYFEAHGFGREQARGITAGVAAETQFKTNAFNGAGGGQGAFGIGQWRGPRLAELRRRYGQNPTLDQQLEFMLWELTNSEAGSGAAIRGAGNSAAALSAYITKFMRPGSGTAGDLRRGLGYLSGGQGAALTSGGAAKGGVVINLDQKTDIHVDGSRDPHATGKAVAGEQGRVHDAMARQLKAAAS